MRIRGIPLDLLAADPSLVDALAAREQAAVDSTSDCRLCGAPCGARYCSRECETSDAGE